MYPADDTIKINSPKLLTKQIHTNILLALRAALHMLKSQPVVNPGVMNLRVRNWLFLYEEGEAIVDIILDKGYSLAEVEAFVVPRLAESSLSFDECAEFHEFLMTTDALDLIADDVQIRVGSPGSEPTLYDLEDYQASIGNMLKVEAWNLIEGRSKFTMILNDIYDKDGMKIIVLAEGAHRFEIPLENIKTAFVLPFHPASKSVKLAKEAARKKARQGASKKYK
ncbi:hypothetical protein [Fluviispira sanaruensis]|uniref:Ribosome maturation factor RimP n=1 Tax=Fluviispira sanaruensis TaxID=2493639 RepID=A0A4P2VM01_FLUSA|nr:hypothetical protein [Fluviispira sanaruensis]BBH54386.1 hypothetical protein JCM31447_28500 [Fluviispira sanaruensis]